MFETLNFSFSEAHWVVITIIAIYTWYLKRESASAQEMLDLRLRVVEIENAIKDMPSKVEITQLQVEVKSLNKQLDNTTSSLNHSIDLVREGVIRIEQHLRENNK